MKKLILLFIALTLIFSYAGCSSHQEVKLQTEDLKEMIIGAELPYLLYANNEYCIMDMWQGGIVIYDFTTQKIKDRITFEQLNDLGFSYTQSMISEDGETIYFREDDQFSNQPYTYSYDLLTKEFSKLTEDVTEVTHYESIFENQQIQALLSDGLLPYGQTIIRFDNTFIVSRLAADGSHLSDTEIVFVNDDLTIQKTFSLFTK